jgi:Protein of unknown function (DUF3618)
MSERTDELRREIEEGRERLGETAGAIGYKTDVPARARDRVDAVKDRLTGAGHRPAGRRAWLRRTRWGWRPRRSRRAC